MSGSFFQSFIIRITSATVFSGVIRVTSRTGMSPPETSDLSSMPPAPFADFSFSFSSGFRMKNMSFTVSVSAENESYPSSGASARNESDGRNSEFGQPLSI